VLHLFTEHGARSSIFHILYINYVVKIIVAVRWAQTSSNSRNRGICVILKYSTYIPTFVTPIYTPWGASMNINYFGYIL